MQIYVLDRDYAVMREIENIISSKPRCTVKCFADTKMLQDAVWQSPPDFLILDISINQMLPLVQQLSSRKDKIRIILMAKDSSYAAEAFELGVSGYLVKPITEEKLLKCLSPDRRLCPFK